MSFCTLARTGALAVAATLLGCANWPNFDYAPLDDIQVAEHEVEGTVAQNLGTLVTRTIVSGNVNSTGTSEAGESNQFSFEGEFYTGDVDYFAFQVSEPSDVAIGLQWDSPSSDVDLFLFRYDPETHGLSELIDAAQEEASPLELAAEAIPPQTLYILVVAGRSGPSTGYDLTILPIPLEEP